MTKGSDLKLRRISSGIVGAVLCKKVGIGRSRLSDIEREYVVPSEDELTRIDAALDGLTRAKRKIAAVAAEEGWPSSL